MTPDRRFVAAMAMTWSAAGLLEPLLPPDGDAVHAVAIAHSFVMSFLMFGWCKTHARRRGIRLPTGAAALMGMVAPIGLPYYALRGFGVARGMLLVLLGLLVMVALLSVYVLAFNVGAMALAMG